MSAKAPPPTTSLRPPTEGSGPKYTMIVVLLAAGLVALLLWRYLSSETAPVVQVPPPKPTVAPPPPKEDDVPPPPPVEDSGPETGPTRTVINSNWASCDAKFCTGKVNGDLEAALAFRAKTAHKCYDDALAQDTSLKGNVKISVRVAANGNICSASVASNELANPLVANCIANRFRQAGHFPAPSGGCLDVNVPIALMPPH